MTLPTSINQHWSKLLPQLTDKERHEFNFHFNRCRETKLDECLGACVLKRPELAKIVADSLLHFDGERYRMSNFVVMPNHNLTESTHRQQTTAQHFPRRPAEHFTYHKLLPRSDCDTGSGYDCHFQLLTISRTTADSDGMSPLAAYSEPPNRTKMFPFCALRLGSEPTLSSTPEGARHSPLAH